MLKNNNFKKFAFTLAEVLITLGVIGIVAALTLPTIMNTINSKVEAHQKQVMETKIVEALNVFNSQENGLRKKYNNTEEFVRALSKYLKMTQICGKNDLKNCLTYDKIVFFKSDGTEDYEDVSSITTAKKMKLNDNFLDPAGFILANGIPIVISFNNDCGLLKDANGERLMNSYNVLSNIPAECIDGIYDINGSKPVNTFGKDIKPFYSAKIGSECISRAGGLCVQASLNTSPEPMSLDYCLENKSKYNIPSCCYDCEPQGGDRWAGAIKYCKDNGMRLASGEDLIKLARYMYNDETISEESFNYHTTLDTSKVPDYLNWGDLWGVDVWVDKPGHEFTFANWGVTYSKNFHRANSSKVICVEE